MIHREDHGTVAVLRMEHGKANALDPELFGELGRNLDEIESSPIRAVVLTGSGRMFSAGVDLKRVTEGGADYVAAFLPLLSAGLRRLVTYPRPVVAAINGHAIAGGCILALACDHRVLARGDARLGVTELLVGVPFPTLAFEVLRSAVPDHRLFELVLTGKLLDPERALAAGLASELADADALAARAVEVAAAMGAIPSASFSLTKRTLRRSVLMALQDDRKDVDELVTSLWQAPEVQGAVRSYVERTLKKV